ncbi:hypothetical protein, partial [Chitinophaga sp.]
MRISLLVVALLAGSAAFAQDNLTYQRPPAVIEELLLAKPTPSVSLSRSGEWMILAEKNPFPSVAELAEPELRIAGLRLNPRNYGPSRSSSSASLRLKHLPSGTESGINGLPQPARISYVTWSPDSRQVAFLQTEDSRIDLYLLDVESKQAVKVNQQPVNATMGTPYAWMGNEVLVYRAVPRGQGALPAAPAAPSGPVAQESKGRSAASRTYQDLIKSPYDEALFAHMATSQIVIIAGKEEQPVGEPGIFASVSVSPDKQFLLARRLEKPFSYLVPAYGFPHAWEVYGKTGKLVKTLAKNPSSEGAPIGFDDVVTTPREFEWKSDEGHTVTFVKALDGGLGKRPAEFRDAVYAQDVTLDAVPKELFRTRRRFDNVVWGTQDMALVYEALFADRKYRISILNQRTGRLDSLYEQSSNDAYSALGVPFTTRNQFDRAVLFTGRKNELLFRSNGASPEGDLPLVQSLDVKTGKKSILWRCQAPFYETVVDVIDPEKLTVLTSRESNTEVPNYYIRDLRKRAPTGRKVTDFENPYKAMEGVQKQKITYKRADGIQLTGDLY